MTQEQIHQGQPKQQEQPEPPVKEDEQQEQTNEEEENYKLDEAIEMTFPASDPISI